MKKCNPCHLWRNESGASLVEMAFMLPLFVLLLFGGVDFGRGFYMVTELAGAAHAGAVYGSENYTDTAGMKTVAEDAAPDVPGLSVTTPTYGCECATASSTYVANCPSASQPTCTGNNLVYLVTVTVKATYTPLFKWPGIPSSMPFSTTAQMRAN